MTRRDIWTRTSHPIEILGHRGRERGVLITLARSRACQTRFKTGTRFRRPGGPRAPKGAVESGGPAPDLAIQDGDVPTPTARARPLGKQYAKFRAARSILVALIGWQAWCSVASARTREAAIAGARFARAPGIYAAPDPSAVATSGSGDSSEEEEASDDEE